MSAIMHIRLHNRNPNERLTSRAQRGRGLAGVRLKWHRCKNIKKTCNIFLDVIEVEKIINAHFNHSLPAKHVFFYQELSPFYFHIIDKKIIYLFFFGDQNNTNTYSLFLYSTKVTLLSLVKSKNNPKGYNKNKFAIKVSRERDIREKLFS